MKQVFVNATILYGEDLEIVEGYVVVEGKNIYEVGEGSYFGKNTDVKGGIIFPSFMNSHMHIGDSVAKDLGAYSNIEERVGKGGIKQRTLEERSSEVPKAIQATLKEMLRGGTTAFCDFREGGLEGIKQLKSALKTPIDCKIMGRPNSDDLGKVLDNCDGIGVSSVKEHTEEELKKISNAVKRSSKLLGVHVGEVEDDLNKALAIKPDFVVHLTNVDGEGLERTIEAGIPVILCPRANAMLGVGIPRLKELFCSTLVALGTDNVMVNSPDMFREMEFTFKIIRGIYKDHMFDAKEVLKGATINGRRIFGLPDNSIKEGNIADFTIIKKRAYTTDPILSLVHRSDSSDIRAVIKNGSMIKN
ncbi:MAG: amidohydrolase family protein [Candidatus Hydrothermarchaeales archaeon]